MKSMFCRTMLAGALWAAILSAQNPPAPSGNPTTPSGMGQPGTGVSPATGAAPAPIPAGPMDMPIQTRVDDKKFIRDAAASSMTDAQLGKLAAEKASGDAVKQYGQKMADQNGQTAEQLRKAAGEQKVEVPESLDGKHKSRVDKLSELSGPKFDEAYLKDQVKEHQKDVHSFQDEAQYGTDPGVKTLAAKMLPVVQQQLQEAKDLTKQKGAR